MTNAKAADAAIEIASALAGAIKTLGSVPSGHLYARVMGYLTLEQYNAAIEALVALKMVRRDRSHLLTWVAK